MNFLSSENFSHDGKIKYFYDKEHLKTFISTNSVLKLNRDFMWRDNEFKNNSKSNRIKTWVEQAVKNMGKKWIQKQKNNEMERISIWFSVITLKVNMSQFIIKKQNLANILTKSKTCALYNRNIYFKQIQRLKINEMGYNIPCNRNT